MPGSEIQDRSKSEIRNKRMSQKRQEAMVQAERASTPERHSEHERQDRSM